MTLHLDAVSVALIAAVMSTVNVGITLILSAWITRHNQLSGWKRDLLYPAVRSFLNASSQHLETLRKALYESETSRVTELHELSSVQLHDMNLSEIELVLLPTRDVVDAATNLRIEQTRVAIVRFEDLSTDYSLDELFRCWSEMISAARKELGVTHGVFRRPFQVITEPMYAKANNYPPS